MKVRMLIGDSSCVFRKGLRALLHERTGIGVVAEAATGEELIRLAMEHDPHVVMLDVMIPGMDGIAVAREILSRRPQARIIGLALHADEATLRQMFDAGATGFLLKDADGEEMILAVETVLNEGIYIGRSMSEALAKNIVQSSRRWREHQQLRRLTAREQEIYELGQRGLRAKEIAEKLFIKTRTVEVHRRHIGAKLTAGGMTDRPPAP